MHLEKKIHKQMAFLTLHLKWFESNKKCKQSLKSNFKKENIFFYSKLKKDKILFPSFDLKNFPMLNFH